MNKQAEEDNSRFCQPSILEEFLWKLKIWKLIL